MKGYTMKNTLPWAFAAVSAVIAFAAPASGEPDGDDRVVPESADFFAALGSAGIGYNSPDQAITAANAVCGLAARGESGLELLKDLKAANPGFTTDSAAQFASIAATSYCPEQLAAK